VLLCVGLPVLDMTQLATALGNSQACLLDPVFSPQECCREQPALPFRGCQPCSPPKISKLRPAPFPIKVDVLPDFDMLPDAMEDGEFLADPNEGCSVPFFGVAATCLAAPRIHACHAANFEEQRQNSPPKAPRLRPAPFPDAVPVFDMLPDAVGDREALIKPNNEDCSMLLLGTSDCVTGISATCLAATDLERPVASNAANLDDEPRHSSFPKGLMLRLALPRSAWTLRQPSSYCRMPSRKQRLWSAVRMTTACCYLLWISAALTLLPAVWWRTTSSKADLAGHSKEHAMEYLLKSELVESKW